VTFLQARCCLSGNRLLLITYHVRNRYSLRHTTPTADGLPRVMIQLTVVTRASPVITLYNAFMAGIPYCGSVTDAAGKKIKPRPALQTITRGFECYFPSMLCDDLISCFYDPAQRAMCLLYSEGEGRNSLIRGGPIGSTHRRGEWLFVESAPIQAIPQTHQAIPTEVCYFLFSFILSSNNSNLSLSL
jgi:hypothetical protein